MHTRVIPDDVESVSSEVDRSIEDIEHEASGVDYESDESTVILDPEDFVPVEFEESAEVYQPQEPPEMEVGSDGVPRIMVRIPLSSLRRASRVNLQASLDEEENSLSPSSSSSGDESPWTRRLPEQDTTVSSSNNGFIYQIESDNDHDALYDDSTESEWEYLYPPVETYDESDQDDNEPNGEYNDSNEGNKPNGEYNTNSDNPGQEGNEADDNNDDSDDDTSSVVTWSYPYDKSYQDALNDALDNDEDDSSSKGGDIVLYLRPCVLNENGECVMVEDDDESPSDSTVYADSIHRYDSFDDESHVDDDNVHTEEIEETNDEDSSEDDSESLMSLAQHLLNNEEDDSSNE